MSFYFSLLHSFLPSLFLSTAILLTGLSHSTHWPYIFLPFRWPCISVFNQLDAQNLFHNKFYFMSVHDSSTCARIMYRHEIKLIVKEILCIKLVKYWNKWPYIVLFPLLKSSTPIRLIKRGLKQKTTYCNDGGNGDDDEAPEHRHYSGAEFLQVRVEWDIITVSLHSTLRLPSPQLELREEQRFRASYTSAHTITTWHALYTIK